MNEIAALGCVLARNDKREIQAMLQAVIFDFDGVITDSEILHLRAFNHVLAQFGIEMTKKDYYKEYLGLTDVDCFNLVAERNKPRFDGQQIEKSCEAKKPGIRGIGQNRRPDN